MNHDLFVILVNANLY